MRGFLRTLLVPLLLLASGSANAEPIPPSKAIAPETAAPGKEPAALAEMDKANESFKKRDYKQALEHLRAARQKDADLPPAQLMLARLYLVNNQLAPGRQALEQAAAEEPAYPGTYLGFGNLAVLEGRLTDASLHYEKAAALTKGGKWPDGHKAYFLLQQYAGQATVAEARKDWKAAKEMLTAWLELDAKNGKARQRLGRALFHLDQRDQAADELARAVKDDPTLEPVAVAMGWLYAQKGDSAKAGEWMESAVKNGPEDPKAHQGMAAWLLQQEKVDKAKEHADTAAKLGASSKDLQMLRGLIARYQKKYGEAEGYFEAARKEAPNDLQAATQLALSLIEQDDKDKRGRALQLAEGSAKSLPNSALTLATLGWVYYRLGRLDEAERLLQAAASSGTITADTAYYYARLLADRGRPDVAKQLLKGALEAPGSFPYRKEAQELIERLNK